MNYRPLMMKCIDDTDNYKKGQFIYVSKEFSIDNHWFNTNTELTIFLADGAIGSGLSSKSFNKNIKTILPLDIGFKQYIIWSVMSLKNGDIIRVGDDIEEGITVKRILINGSLEYSLRGSNNKLYSLDRTSRLDNILDNTEDYFIGKDDVIIREGFSKCLYKIIRIEDKLHIYNIGNSKHHKKFIYIKDAKSYLSNKSLTKDEFSKLLLPSANIETFKPIDIMEVYNNCKDL